MNWEPASFAERGVAVPFTTPQLLGARARVAERGCDLVLPNPGGPRGVYIFTLASIGDFCTLTLHDVRFAAHLASLHPLTPQTMRHAARIVAAEGAAGRAAAAAAIAASARDAQRRAMFQALLLGGLLRKAEVPELVGLQHRTRQSVQQLAVRTGRDAEHVKADLDRLAELLADAGLDTPGPVSGGAVGRIGRVLAEIETLAPMVRAWNASNGPSPAAAHLALAADTIVGAGNLARQQAQDLLTDLPELLAAWARAPAEVAAMVNRPSWLLDGWEQICLVWQLAQTGATCHAAIAEAATLIPPLPPEADPWLPQDAELRVNLHNSRASGSRSGADSMMLSDLLSLVERNERIRTLAA